jgi:(p)ppGpp synthase/HD superfamily hydrolase
MRKGTSIPYMSHLLAVASLVMEDGGDDDQVAAALLHDAAEDQGGEATLSTIRSEFGDVVESIVRACSDSIEDVGVEKAPWRERKERALQHVGSAPEKALIVIAADKLHNLRSIAADLAFTGPSVWDRFNAGQQDILWYYDSMHAALASRIPASRSVRLLGVERAQLDSGNW